MTQTYEVLRVAYQGPDQPVDKEFLRKTARLVQEHAHTREIRPPEFEQDLTPEVLMGMAQQDKPDNVKVFNLLVAIRKIVEEKGNQTPYLLSICEKAEKIAEAFEEHLDSAQEALLELIEIAKEYDEVRKRRKETNLSDEAFMTLIHLEKSGVEGAEKIAADSSVVFESYPHWRDSTDQEREVKLAFYKTLKGTLETKKMVELVDGLLTMLRNKSG